MYKRYGKVVSLMGCRASLSPWYERGGMTPADDQDEPVFEGRFNLGAISLHLPMILAKARQESRDFYEVLDYYLEMIRNLHKRTYDFLGEKKASINPLGFCEGGFYGGHLKPDDKIRSILPPMTMSFGITALNELQELYNGKSLVEDGAFALEVLEHINHKIEEYKDHIYIKSYVEDSTEIIKKLQELASSGVSQYTASVDSWISREAYTIDDDGKKEALRQMFANSHVALILWLCWYWQIYVDQAHI